MKEKPWYWYDVVEKIKRGYGPWLDLSDSDRELSLSRYCDTEEEKELLGIWPFGTRLISKKPRLFGVFKRYIDPETLPFCYMI